MLGSSNGLYSITRNGSPTHLGWKPVTFGSQELGEVFALDYVKGNHNVVLSSGRRPKVYLTDLRADSSREGTSFIRVPSPIAHARSLSEHLVLLAGLKSEMAVYDTRYFPTGNPNRFKPLIHFPGYVNPAHFNIGFDVSLEQNIVAVAQSDCKVRLFSLKSGETLKCNVLKPMNDNYGVVSRVQFMKMPHEALESLWVGVPGAIEKYTFGKKAWDNDG